jgi:hypothetical protein
LSLSPPFSFFLSLALDFFLPPKLNIPMAGRYSTPLEASREGALTEQLLSRHFKSDGVNKNPTENLRPTVLN